MYQASTKELSCFFCFLVFSILFPKSAFADELELPDQIKKDLTHSVECETLAESLGLDYISEQWDQVSRALITPFRDEKGTPHMSEIMFLLGYSYGSTSQWTDLTSEYTVRSHYRDLCPDTLSTLQKRYEVE
ncbi:hypothetical protein [Shewanella gaetbuli]